MHIDKLTGIVVDLCIKIHKKVGPGCFEKVYEEILNYELSKLGIKVVRQMLFPISWEILLVPNAYKLDMLIDDQLVLELKSLHPLPAVYFDQIRTQLTLLNLKEWHVSEFQNSINEKWDSPGF